MSIRNLLERLTTNASSTSKVFEQDILLLYINVPDTGIATDTPLGLLSVATVLKHDKFALKCLTSKNIQILTTDEKKKMRGRLSSREGVPSFR